MLTKQQIKENELKLLSATLFKVKQESAKFITNIIKSDKETSKTAPSTIIRNIYGKLIKGEVKDKTESQRVEIMARCAFYYSILTSRSIEGEIN